MLLLNLTFLSLSWRGSERRNSRQEPGARNWSRDKEGVLLTCLLFVACSACIFNFSLKKLELGLNEQCACQIFLGFWDELTRSKTGTWPAVSRERGGLVNLTNFLFTELSRIICPSGNFFFLIKQNDKVLWFLFGAYLDLKYRKSSKCLKALIL